MNVLELIFNDMLRRTEEDTLARRLLIAGADGYNQRMAEINHWAQRVPETPRVDG